jgi:hypothetical protein
VALGVPEGVAALVADGDQKTEIGAPGRYGGYAAAPDAVWNTPGAAWLSQVPGFRIGHRVPHPQVCALQEVPRHDKSGGIKVNADESGASIALHGKFE